MSNNASKVKLLRKGFLAVLDGDYSGVSVIAQAMTKDFDFWNDYLKDTAFQVLPEVGGITVEQIRDTKDPMEVTDLLIPDTAKTLASALYLGVLELREQPIERLAFKGALTRHERLKSLLVLAGYSVMSSANEYADIRESLVSRSKAVLEVKAVVAQEEAVEASDEAFYPHEGNANAYAPAHYFIKDRIPAEYMDDLVIEDHGTGNESPDGLLLLDEFLDGRSEPNHEPVPQLLNDVREYPEESFDWVFSKDLFNASNKTTSV